MSPPSISSPKPFNIAIVGGGITGLTLAISLLKNNVPVVIYESAAQFGEIGAGVGFGPNAVRAMEMISPDIKDGFERCRTHQWESKDHVWFTVRVGDHRKANVDGNVKEDGQQHYKVGDAIFEVQFTADGSKGGVHRAHFLNQLVKLIPESVPQFGKRLQDVTKAHDSDDIILHFADGTSAQHTAVLGCDGIKSRTRELLLGQETARAVFTGKYVYRGLIPMTEAIEMLGEEQAMNSQMLMGYDGHIITFPIERGKTMNVVAFRSCEKWSDPNWVVRTSREEMLADYKDWGPTATAIISAMKKPDIWALFNHLPAPTYFGLRPRICLVGDAAHASTPHQGAGAGMCIEDCLILGTLIGEAKDVGELDKAFRAYDEVRRPRTQMLVKTSREAAMVYEFQSKGDDLEAIERDMTSRMDWIWNVDLGCLLFRTSALTPCPDLMVSGVLWRRNVTLGPRLKHPIENIAQLRSYSEHSLRFWSTEASPNRSPWPYADTGNGCLVLVAKLLYPFRKVEPEHVYLRQCDYCRYLMRPSRYGVEKRGSKSGAG